MKSKTTKAEVEKKVSKEVHEILDGLDLNSARIMDMAENALTAIQQYRDDPCTRTQNLLLEEVMSVVELEVPELLNHAKYRLDALYGLLSPSHRDIDRSEG